MKKLVMSDEENGVRVEVSVQVSAHGLRSRFLNGPGDGASHLIAELPAILEKVLPEALHQARFVLVGNLERSWSQLLVEEYASLGAPVGGNEKP